MSASRHTVSYTVLNRHEALHYPPEFEVHATPEELEAFALSLIPISAPTRLGMSA